MTNKTFYNLPSKVKFCKKCVLSNQKPYSVPEFKHNDDKFSKHGAKYLDIDESGLCEACRYNKQKNEIDWEKREKELITLLDKHRSSDGSYDCLVPGSGGKDSMFQAHVLKYKYGMNPLTVTWPPVLYTDYGYKNFRNWIEIGGFDNITFKPNGNATKLLTKLSILNLLHPFQTFILGQKNLAPKIASKYDIKLVFYGENEAEYGNPIAETMTSLRSKSYFTMKNLDEIYLAGVSIKELREKYKLKLSELMPFLPMTAAELEKKETEIHYLGYYLKWLPQEAYYYAVENCGFKARPFRTQGTYSKYNGIDDKIDDLHFYTTFIKFGIGRTTYDASQEIRNNHITRDEAKALVKRFDGEFPNRYFKDILDFLNIDESKFFDLCDQFRPPHLWKKINNEWKLRHTVNLDGSDD
jgi:N-acetyl sugar amidotransferase